MFDTSAGFRQKQWLSRDCSEDSPQQRDLAEMPIRMRPNLPKLGRFDGAIVKSLRV